MQNNNKKKGKKRLTKGIERMRGACKASQPSTCMLGVPCTCMLGLTCTKQKRRQAQKEPCRYPRHVNENGEWLAAKGQKKDPT
jgi:hypothetical protein